VSKTFNRVLVVTGSGISVESGIPTFRGPGGYWRNLDPTRLATAAAFARGSCCEFRRTESADDAKGVRVARSAVHRCDRPSSGSARRWTSIGCAESRSSSRWALALWWWLSAQRPASATSWNGRGAREAVKVPAGNLAPKARRILAANGEYLPDEEKPSWW
jgi:hypothetical protein